MVVSGPSGSGKSTVVRRALERPGQSRSRLSISATTRAPRPGERDGVRLSLPEREAFEEARDRGEFLERAEYNDQLLRDAGESPSTDALASGTMGPAGDRGAGGAPGYAGTAPSAFFLFIRTPTFRELEQRLRLRGTEDEASILRRLRKARDELAEAHWYDIQLINDDLDRCVEEFLAALRSNG